MEPLYTPHSKMISRINLMSHLVVYYGYLHECAELFRQLWKTSRKEWDNNHKALTEVIMKHEQCKMVIDFGDKFTSNSLRFLLTDHNYCYYKIKAKINDLTSFRLALKLVQSVDTYSPKLFDLLDLRVNKVRICRNLINENRILWSCATNWLECI